MIRYRCPRCQKPLTAQDNEAGSKKNCPHCEQRVQIPAPPPPNKTMLACWNRRTRRSSGRWKGRSRPSPRPPTRTQPRFRPCRTPLLSRRRTTRRTRWRKWTNGRDAGEGHETMTMRTTITAAGLGNAGPTAHAPGAVARTTRQHTRFGGASIALLIIGLIFWPLIIVAFFVQEKWTCAPTAANCCGRRGRASDYCRGHK